MEVWEKSRIKHVQGRLEAVLIIDKSFVDLVTKAIRNYAINEHNLASRMKTLRTVRRCTTLRSQGQIRSMAITPSRTGHDERTSSEPRSSSLHPVTISRITQVNRNIKTFQLTSKHAINVRTTTHQIKEIRNSEHTQCADMDPHRVVQTWPMARCLSPRTAKTRRIHDNISTDQSIKELIGYSRTCNSKITSQSRSSMAVAGTITDRAPRNQRPGRWEFCMASRLLLYY